VVFSQTAFGYQNHPIRILRFPPYSSGRLLLQTIEHENPKGFASNSRLVKIFQRAFLTDQDSKSKELRKKKKQMRGITTQRAFFLFSVILPVDLSKTNNKTIREKNNNNKISRSKLIIK
jgi:AICAR transformylase/IMP cyclohydrolase PurH